MTLLGLQPGLELLAIGAILTIALNIVNKKLVDQKRLKRIQNDIKEFQKEHMQAVKGQDEAKKKKLEERQPEINKLISESMSMSMRPLMYTAIPMLAIFGYLHSIYNNDATVIVLPLLGDINWFWWYFYTSMLTSIILLTVEKFTKKGEKNDKGNAQK
ncbi:MAG: DUF106 domain-containing protein [DPANN group archaeon]|nr:DUF106 domain-containing protein [DPANN group archaeon]